MDPIPEIKKGAQEFVKRVETARTLGELGDVMWNIQMSDGLWGLALAHMDRDLGKQIKQIWDEAHAAAREAAKKRAIELIDRV